jgi:hypothetical protein
MPNPFQMRAGQWEQTRPSLSGGNGPPFTGVYNILSQVYDANISLDELMPEIRDPRYLPDEHADYDGSEVSDMVAKPDQLTAAQNRYTHIMGV